MTVTVANPDTTAPTVSLTAPADGATVSGTVTLSATASDNVGVAGVQFLVDGAPLGAEDTTSPYSVSWNTTTVTNGSHTLTAVARDAAGNTTTSAPVTVTVANTAQIPVAITAIAVGTSPTDAVVSGNKVYVSSSEGVFVIDKTTKQVTAPIQGVGPGALAVSPNRSTLYVANQYAQSVSVVDTTSGQVVDTMAFFIGDYYNGVWDLEMSPDGKKLYVGLGDSTVAVVDTATRKVVSTPTYTDFWDGDMELSPDGTLLYGTSPGASVVDGFIVVIDTATMSYEYPDDYVPVTDGRYWYSELAVSGKRVYEANPDGSLLVIDTDPTHTATYNTQIATINIPAGARDVALSPDGSRAYVTSWDGKTVTVVNTTTNTVIGTFTTDQSGGSGQEQFITVDPVSGTLYITDPADGMVYVVTVGDSSTAQQM